jgi:cytosine/adenosine deaminase-related metal-dependent hydrolase
LRDGTLTIAGERILAVEPSGSRAADIDLGESIILPGLVNAHTHLDLTGLRGQTPPGADFPGWLAQVIRHRRATPAEQVAADIRAGLQESVRYGTTLLGDIAGQGWSWQQLTEAPIRSVVFYELLGLPENRAQQALADATAWLRLRSPSTTCRLGLGPHAPYSARASLIVESRKLSERSSLAWGMHLAETEAEGELLSQRRGPLVPFLQALGVWDRLGLVSAWQEILAVAAGQSPAVLAHCNYLPLPEPGQWPANAAVVYCPRTHAAFGHPPHPWRQLQQRGIRVALGTDSLASNPDLDVLGEARFLFRRFPEIPAAELIRLATLSGAEALGWSKETGSLEAGKSADFVLLPLPHGAPEIDPCRAILASELPVQVVFCRGRCIHRAADSKLDLD